MRRRLLFAVSLAFLQPQWYNITITLHEYRVIIAIPLVLLTAMSHTIFLNDKIIKETEGFISAMDRGFLYGDGLFETLRTYRRNPFCLEDHVGRLSYSSKYFDIPFHHTLQQIRYIIGQLIAQNGLSDAYIRMTLSRGSSSHGLIPRHPCNPTFAIHAKPLTVYPPAWRTTGLSLMTSSFRRSDTCPVSSHKTLNFMTNYLVKKEAIDHGYHDAIILNTNNQVTECAVSNVFIVEKNTVITPSLKTNILPGVTRKIILRLCKESGISVSEEEFGMERVLAAEEIFVTNSLMEVMPASKIDGKPIGNTVPGAITKILQDRYTLLTNTVSISDKPFQAAGYLCEPS